jgi:hypothetical protein
MNMTTRATVLVERPRDRSRDLLATRGVLSGFTYR